MHFTIDRDYFIQQLNHVARAISGKATIPILTGLKIVLTDTQLTLTGSDSSISIESTTQTNHEPAKLESYTSGSIVLPARLFIEIIRKLPDTTVELTLQENLNLIVKSGKAEFTIQGIDSLNYPALPEFDTSKQMTITGIIFKKMVNQTIFSASNQETRPIITGLNLTFNATHLTSVATDSHRLSKRDVPIQTVQENLNGESITIPKKTVVELTKIIEDDTVLTLYVMPQQVVFMFDNLVIYSRLLEGSFPDISRLIPSTHNTELVVDTQLFIQAIERAALLVHIAKSNIVQLKIDSDYVALLVRNTSIGQSVEEINYESVSGQSLTIAFNPDYMREAVKAFGHSTIKLSFISGDRPLLLTSATQDEIPHNELVQLLTPIRTHH